MQELSLFTGAGGGLLGTQLLDWHPVGYIEIDRFCQEVLSQRINDGLLDKAPIFTDVREFLQSGAAQQYRGFVDVVTAGFPCQPFSIAGRQAAEQDKRNMWPATISIIRTIRPRYCLLENVPGLLGLEYIRTVFRDLAEAGYHARWCVLGADDCAAPHHRKRLWILAYTESERIQGCRPSGQQESHTPVQEKLPVCKSKRFINASWKAEPRMDRVVDGMANRVDRIKALGNGQVPVVATTAWHLLNDFNTPE